MRVLGDCVLPSSMRPCVERYRRGAGAGSRQNGNQSFVAAKLARLPTSGAYIRRGGYAQVTSPEVGARLAAASFQALSAVGSIGSLRLLAVRNERDVAVGRAISWIGSRREWIEKRTQHKSAERRTDGLGKRELVRLFNPFAVEVFLVLAHSLVTCAPRRTPRGGRTRSACDRRRTGSWKRPRREAPRHRCTWPDRCPLRQRRPSAGSDGLHADARRARRALLPSRRALRISPAASTRGASAAARHRRSRPTLRHRAASR